MNVKIEQTFPYIQDIITPTGRPQSVDSKPNAVHVTVDPTIDPVSPSTVVTLSTKALILLQKGIA
jgi:hypothetical protein